MIPPGARIAIVCALASSAACLVEYQIPEPEEVVDPEDCATPLLICDNACVDPEVDEGHCGVCGNECELGDQCVEGECIASCADCDPFSEVCDAGQCVCRAGLEFCGEECLPLYSDADNCGACGEGCIDGELCIDGECLAEACPADECDGICTDFGFDPLNCGACGRACLGDELCIDSACRAFEVIEGCGECPCPEQCDPEIGETCCFSELLDVEVCYEGGECL